MVATESEAEAQMHTPAFVFGASISGIPYREIEIRRIERDPKIDLNDTPN